MVPKIKKAPKLKVRSKKSTSADTKPVPKVHKVGWVYSVRDIAIAFAVSDATVKKWITLGMPQHTTHYCLIEIAQWYFYQQFEKEGVTTAQQEKIEFDRDLRKLKYEREKLAYEEYKGTLIPVEEAEQQTIKKVIAVKKHFGALGERLAPALYGLEPKEIKRIITERVNEILEQFSK